MFYTYIHRKSDNNKIFYVGKGTVSKKRAFEHTNRNKHWLNVVKKHGLNVEIVAFWCKEQEALDHEIFLIDCFRTLGHPLVNLTNGGDGISGYTHSNEFKKWQSERVKKEYENPEQKEKRRLSQIKRFASDEVRKKHGEIVKSRWTIDAKKEAGKKLKEFHIKNGHPRQKVTKNMVDEMFVLKTKGLELQEIANILKIHKDTVGKYLRGQRLVP